MKPENKSTQAISAQVHDWAAENRQLRKELRVREKRVEELEALASSLNKQLCEKIDQINDMMQKLMAFMTGDGGVNISESLRQSIVAEVRSEFEAREQELEKAYTCEREELTSKFNARLEAMHNELNQVKGLPDGDNSTSILP
jgi:hypothetical protein